MHRTKASLYTREPWELPCQCNKLGFEEEGKGPIESRMITLKGNDVVSKFSMTKQKFINQWLRHFAKGVTKKQIEQYVKDQFIWHIFSYELIKPARLLDGDDARRAFDQIEKNDCICCDMFGSNGVTNKLSNRFDTAKKIDAEMLEFYVVASDYSWTYIKTHEDDFCGPYFLRNTE